jgi:hypothetical protein
LQIDRLLTAPSFTDSYGGDILGSDGITTIYVTARGHDAIADALSNAAIPSSAYQLVTVEHTLAELHQRVMTIAADSKLLMAQGSPLVQWQPDPASNTVLAYIDNYSEAQAQALQAQYGGPGWITVEPWTGPKLLQPAENRFYDDSPFASGDRIFPDPYQNWGCTSGFTIVGNVAGYRYNTTAGHCRIEDPGYGGYWTNFTDDHYMGDQRTNYLPTYDNFDLVDFHCDSCGEHVWYGDNATHLVISWCDCNVGQNVTFDGATTQEVTDSYVEHQDVCVLGGQWSDGYTRCHMQQARNTTTICQDGDSGGPVYQRQSGGVYATGTIVGGEYREGGYQHCYYDRFQHVLSSTNASLYTG